MKHVGEIDLVLAGFQPWVEQQPSGLDYPYWDNCGCAFAQYLQAIGYPRPNIGGSMFSLDILGQEHLFPSDIRFALRGTPYTFGALAKRLAA